MFYDKFFYEIQIIGCRLTFLLWLLNLKNRYKTFLCSLVFQKRHQLVWGSFLLGANSPEEPHNLSFSLQAKNFFYINGALLMSIAWWHNKTIYHVLKIDFFKLILNENNYKWYKCHRSVNIFWDKKVTRIRGEGKKRVKVIMGLQT